MGTKNAHENPQNQSNGRYLTISFPVPHGWEDFLNRMVTGNETWVAHVNVETKQQSMTWGHASSPTRLRKARQTLSARKLMVTVFWDVQGILLIQFITRGTTINSEVIVAS
ncbi:mariner Mos1 transposase [Trichonephila clavipes]|nr:mariner Mos1 transposase [Trichonephila clavipes]